MEVGAPAIPPSNLTFILGADSGDYMTLNADHGDGTTETLSIRFHNNMPNITHYYSKPGRFEGYFDLYCAYNLMSVPVEVYVVYPINNTTVVVTNTEPGGYNYLELTVDDGTDVNVTVLWGDGDVTHELQANFTSLNTTLPHQYAYSHPVTMTVLVYISNALSKHFHNITMGTDLHIVNLEVTPSATIVSLDDTVTFTRTVTQASQLHCNKDYGDGSSEYSFQETIPTSDTTDHQYTTIGSHHYNYTCWNHLDNATSLGTIFLHEAITGVVPSVEAGGAYVLDADFVVTWTFSTGEPAYFNASIGGIKANETTVSYSPTKQGSATFYAGMLMPGEHLFKLTGENALTPWSDEFVISLDRLIDGLAFNVQVIDPDYVVVGRPTTVMVGQTNGSRVTDTVLLDGVAYYNASFLDLEGGPHSRNHSVWFSSPGTKVVSLVSSNTVGNVTASNTFTVRAELPLNNLTLEVSCGCVGSKEVTLSLELSEGLPPSNALVDIDYGDGTTVTGVAVSITDVGDAGAAKYTHTYATTGTFFATVTASNPVSTLGPMNVLVDVAEKITDLNVDIPTATVFGESTSINVTAASGSDINVTCSFGDGTADFFGSYATASLVESPITHTYGTIGDHNVTVTIINSKLTYTKSRIVQVDQVIEGYGRTASHAVFGSANSVIVNTTSGSRINLFVDPDVEGGDGYVYDLCVDTSPSSTQLDFTYTVAGVYLVMVSLTNSQGQSQDKFAVAANVQVDLNMVGPSTINYTDSAMFNRTVTGSHVSCNVQYGDGNVKLTYEDTPDALMVFEHNYTEIGVYEFETSCYNYVSEESVAWTVYVQEAIEGYVMYTDMTFAAAGQPLNFNLNITAGTNVTVTVTYSPLEADVNEFVTWDGLSGNLELPHHVHGFGSHDVNITIGNAVTRIENVFQVVIDEALSNFMVTTDEYVPAATEIVLTVSANTGSNVCVGIDFGNGTDQETYTTGYITGDHCKPQKIVRDNCDFNSRIWSDKKCKTCTVDASFLRTRCGDPDITQAVCEAIACCYDASDSTVQCFMPDVITGPWNLTVRNTFTTEGLREIAVSADNSISSYFQVARVYVQYPVENIITIVDVTRARAYQIGIHLKADSRPTDAYVRIELTDGGDNVTVPFTATLGSDQIINCTLPYDDVFEATITIYNNISSLVLSHFMIVEAPFVNVSLNISGPQLLGDAHILKLTFDKGLDGNLSCDLGDGTSFRYSIKSINNIPEMNHTYGAIGSYEVICVLDNTLSSQEIRHIADVDINITGVTLNFSHILVPTDQPPYPTVYNITVATGSRLNILLYDTHCNNVAYQVTNDVSDIVSPTFNCNIDEIPALNPGKLEIFNSITFVEIFFTQLIQQDFSNVSVEINKDVLEFGVEEVEFMMTGGGNKANILYDLGNNVTYETNLTSDGHNFSYMYPEYGTYNYTVTLTNDIDNFVKTGTVHVEIEITLECDEDLSFEKGGPLLVKCQWSGTNGEHRAYFDGAEVTPEVDYTSQTANITIADPEVGTSTVIFNVSNHINTAESVVNIDIDVLIEDIVLSTTASYTAVNESFTLTAATISGTRLKWFVAYGDSSNKSVDDTSILVSGNHTIFAQYAYPNPGYHDIIVMVGNSLTTLFRSIFHGTEFPIVKENLAIEVPTRVDRPGVEIEWSISLEDGYPPTGVQAKWDWTDVVEENVTLELMLDERIYRSHKYSTYFTPTEMTSFLRNNISNASWTSLIQVGIDIEGLNLTVDRIYKQVNKVVEFTFHLEEGSRVMYQFDKGDNSPNEFRLRNDSGSWEDPDIQSTNHTYNQSGLFTATLTANNSLGTVTVSQSVKLEYCILGTEIQQVPPITHPPGVVQYIISVVDDQYMSPTDVTCDFDYGNGEKGTVSAVFNTNKEFQHIHTYAQSTSPGHYNTSANCSNYVCSEDYLTEVWLVEPIVEIVIDIINVYIEAPGLGNFTLKINNGSHLTVSVNYGDGTPNTSYTSILPPTTLHVSHLYETDMNSTVSVEAKNVLESQTTVSAVKYVIQNPIIELILTSNTPIDYAASTGQFYIDIEPSSTGPTDVFCKWRFFDGGVEETTFAPQLWNGDTHVAETTYTRNEIGEQTVSVNCSNYISWKTYSNVIEVAEAIDGVNLVPSHTHGTIGETVITFTLSVTNGSNVSASIDFGDGEIFTTAFADLIANKIPVVVTHIYNITGFFLPVATVNNSLKEPQQAQSEEVVIEYPVLPDGIKISGLNVTRYAETVTLKAELIQENEPSNTMIKWIYGNGEEYEESLTFSGGTYEHLYDYSIDGWFNVTAQMWNNVSTAEATFLEQVGTRISGVNVECPKDVMTKRETTCIAHVDQGSEVEYVITIGNGDVTPVQKRSDNAGGWLALDDSEITFIIDGSGDFSLYLTARNVFDDITVDLGFTLNVEHRVNASNISHLETHPIPDGQVEIIIENLEDVAPTDAKCDLFYGDGLSDIGVDMVMTAENKFVRGHQYQGILPGVRTININCSNQVSSQVFDGTVLLQEPISIPTAGIEQPYVRTNAISTIWVLIDNGTHVTYHIEHGDELSTDRFIEYPPKVTETVKFNHAYAAANNYTITITLNNDISNQTIVVSPKMVIQNPITGLYLFGDISNPYPPGDFNLTVKANKNDPPTDLFCRYKFYTGQPLVESFVASSIGVGELHIQRHTYTRDKVGRHIIFVNCSNYINYMFKSLEIRVDEVITGFNVHISKMYVVTGGSVVFTFSIVEGTDVAAYIAVGDVVSEWNTDWQFEASRVNLTFEKQFDTAANLSMTFKVKNDISQMTITPPQKLAIQDPVPKSSVTTASPVYARGIGQLIVTPRPGSEPSTDVFISWKSDLEEWETYSPNLAIPSTHTEDHDFQTIGDILLEVVIKNKISEFATSLVVHIEDMVRHSYIELHKKAVLVNELVSFSIGVLNGSHLHCDIDFKDGSPTETVIHPDKLNGKSLIISHAFVHTGNFSISVTCYNNVSTDTVTASEEIIVQGDIHHFNISGPNAILLDLPETADAVFTIAAPSHEVLKNVHLAWSVGNESLYTYADTYKSDYTYDLSYRFDGSVLGPVNIAVNASNLMRWNIAHMTTHVYLKIKDLDFNVTSTTLRVNSGVRVTVWVSSGSEITCAIGYGDGIQESHFIENYNSVCQFDHKYASPGNYSINVTVANEVSQLSKRHSVLIIVQIPIKKKDMTLIAEKYPPNPPGKATFELMVNSGEPIPTDVNVTASYGNGTIQQHLFITAFPLKLVYMYSSALADRQIGEKVIVLNLTNLVSSDSIVETIHLQEPINIASINHSKYTPVNTLTPIIVIFESGSDVEVEIKSADGNDQYLQVDGKVESVQVNASYSRAGLYSIEVFSRNEVSSRRFTKPDTIEAQHPVRDIKLLPVGPYLKLGADGNPNQPANFTIIKTPGAEIPSNTTITIRFGDDKPDFSEEKMIAPRYLHRHMYDQVGNYSFEVTVFNGVSSLTFNGTVVAEMEITGCDFTVEQSGNQDDKIRVNTDITLKATASGSDIRFTLTPEPGVSISSTGPEFTYRFQKVRTFSVQLECSNFVSKMTKVHDVISVSGIDIANVGFEPAVELNTTVTFVIYLREAVNAVCFSYDFQGLLSSSKFWRGDLEVCKVDSDFNEEKYLEMEQVSTDRLAYTTVARFPLVAEYNVTFTAFDKVASKSQVRHLSVTAVPCNPPSVEAEEGATVNETLSYKRSQEFTLSPSRFTVKKSCKATDIYMTSLRIYFYMVTETESDWVQMDLGEGDNAGYIRIKRNTLSYGQYYLLYTLQPEGLPEKSSSSKMYFKIEGTALTASINNKKLDVIGTMLDYKLKVIADDPDDDPRPFGYEQYCIPELDIWSNETDEDIIHRLDQSELVEVPSGIPEEVPPPDHVGCFGKPPGRVNRYAADDELEFNTGWMPYNRTYAFIVLVSKGERKVIVRIDVRVTEGNPPQITIECYRDGGNCKQGVRKVDPKKPLQLTFRCDNCQNNSVPTFETAFTRLGKPIEIPPGTAKKAKETTLSDGKTILWSQDVSNFTNPGFYQLEVTIKLLGSPDGFSAFSFAVNQQPYGGTVIMQPPPGSQQSKEEFVPRPWADLSLVAVGWKDDGDEVVTVDELKDPARKRREVTSEETYEENYSDLEFSYSYVKKGKEIPILGNPIKLPEGHPSEDYMIEIIVVVTDIYGGKATYSKSFKIEEQLYDDPEEAAAAEAKKEELKDSIINQDLSKATDVASALSQIISAVSDTPEAGSGSAAPGSGPTKEEAEAARLEEAKQQDRLETVMTGLVNLASSSSSDPETIEATFKAFAVIVKQQTGAASSSLKSDSLDIAASFLDRIDEQEDKKESVISFVDVMADAIIGALATEAPPPEPEEDDVPSADEDDSDEAAAAAAKAAEEAELAKKAAANLISSSKSIIDAMKDGVVVDGDPVIVGDKKLSVTMAVTTYQRVNGTTLETGGSAVTFPALSTEAKDEELFAIFFKMVYTEENPFMWDASAKDITDGVTIVDITDQDDNPLDVEITEPLKIDMEQTEALDNWANMDNMTVDQQSNLIYMYVPVDVDRSAFIMELDLDTFDDSTDIYFEVYFKFGATDAIMDRPNATQGSYDLVKEVPDRTQPFPWVIIIAEAQVQLPGIYIGVIPKVRNSTQLFNQTTVPPFNMRSSLPRCRSWDMTEEIWSGKSCKVDHDSSIDRTRCKCGELNRAVRTYSGGLSVPKVNTIDFSKVFANFSDLLAANPTVLATILIIFIIYLLLLIWARRADQKDLEKWCVTPLVDNPLNCPHLYKVSVYTGLRQGAGTHSKVCFILSGENGDTGVRVLDDGRGKNFERATLWHFLMTTEQPLGELTFLRVWHDNSGQGPAASWFLDKIVIEDILGRTRYFFLNGRWLAVDEDDGQVDRLLPTAAHEEIDGFNHIFFSQARHNLTDDHLWISVLSRPTKSSFTRAQRLTCCLALLCTTMVANAMWYGSAEAVEEDQVIRIGPIVLSVAVLLVSIFSSLTVVPINLILVQLFRKSRPWDSTKLLDGSEVRTTETGQKGIPYMRSFSMADKNAEEQDGEDLTEDDKGKKKSKKKEPRKYWFPWWGVVIAWVVALLASVGSLFFVLLYSLQWGKLKSEEWLSSLLMAFFQSVIIVQPFKVVVVAMMMSLVFKKFKDEEEEVPLNPTTGPGSEEYDEVLHIDRKMFANAPMMPNKRKLEKARRQRELDKKLTNILLEIISYFFFLLLVAFIAFGTFDTQRYRHTDHLRRLLQGAEKNHTVQWVTDQTKMWNYLDVTVADVLFNVRDYTNSLTIRSDRRYLKDNRNVRVGAVRLRQVRVKPALCDPPEITRGLILECNPPYDITREQKANFSTFWLNLPENHTDAATELEEAFRYKGIIELKGSLTIGRQALYNGGGYVANLGTSPNKARRVIRDLMNVFWVDYYTRAVFLEFTVYNANTNLFGFVQYVFEIPASGGVLPMTFVYSFSVYTVFSVMGTVVLICQILYILILLYIMVREIRKMLKETPKIYFLNPWNIYEVVVIVASLIAIAMFGAREAAGRLVTKELGDNKDGHTYYERLATYTDVLTVVIGLVVFLTNIRFMRLLRLNHHVVDLYRTLRDARKELMYFSVTFFIVFSSYSLPAVIFYGTWMYGHSDIFKSVSGTFNILLGRLYWYEMMIASPWITPVYFFTLVVTLYFILVNMFISILTSSYRFVQDTPNPEKESDYKIMAFVSAKVASFLSCCSTKEQPETGKDYLDNLDCLDDRVNHINNMINNYYRENIKSKYQDTKPNTMETKGDTNDATTKKKLFTDMFHF